MDAQIARRVRLLQGLSSDRRSSVRVPVSLEVRYSVAGRRGPVENRSGQTIDVSSSGLSFTADRPLPIGQKFDLSIDWPFRLDGDVQLQLVASGVVVRTTGAVTALRIERYEFRTRRAGARSCHGLNRSAESVAQPVRKCSESVDGAARNLQSRWLPKGRKVALPEKGCCPPRLPARRPWPHITGSM
jgi:hypothetical protein